jgi:hypothetical protein
MQSAYNVYTLQQAACRSWRIGQQQAANLFFIGYTIERGVDCDRGEGLSVTSGTRPMIASTMAASTKWVTGSSRR